MNTFFVLTSAAFLVFSAIAIAIHRENRWAVVAWWINGVSASSILLGLGAELLAIVMALSSTLATVAYFFHADTLSSVSVRAESKERAALAQTVFSGLVSAGFGLAVFLLLRSVISGAVRPIGTASRGEGFVTEESFVAIQLCALMGLVLVIGAGVVSRPRRRND